MIFKKFGGEQIEELRPYLKEILSKDSTLEFSLGCDSKQYRHYTIYVVALICWSPIRKNGAHIIFYKDKVKKIRNTFQRLMREVELLMSAGLEIDEALRGINYEKPIKDDYHKLVNIHIDLNPNEDTGSHSAYLAAMPWLKGLGFHTIAKPDAHASSCAADLLCK